MRAKDALRILVSREGRAPALLAAPGRVDRIEVVEIDSGEVVLLWDCAPREAARRARALREDLIRMDREEFLARWGGEELSDDGR